MTRAGHVPLTEKTDADIEGLLDSVANIYKTLIAEQERRREAREFRAETERRRRHLQVVTS